MEVFERSCWRSCMSKLPLLANMDYISASNHRKMHAHNIRNQIFPYLWWTGLEDRGLSHSISQHTQAMWTWTPKVYSYQPSLDMANKQKPYNIASGGSLVLDLPPSCIEFSPTAPDLLVVGTYYLDTTTTATRTQDDFDDRPLDAPDTEALLSQQRSGSLVLLRLVDDEVYGNAHDTDS